MNTVALTGRLTRDPELRELPDGTPVCTIRLATDDGGGRDPLYIDVTTFGAGAAACAEYLSKGRYVEVQGRLRYSEWQTDDGAKRSRHEVVGRVGFGPDRPRDAEDTAEAQEPAAV